MIRTSLKNADGAKQAYDHLFVKTGTLTYAKASYKSLYGEVESSWEKQDDKTIFTVTVPANCAARLMLPDGNSWILNAGKHSYTV